jgi:hypothetical protein
MWCQQWSITNRGCFGWLHTLAFFGDDLIADCNTFITDKNRRWTSDEPLYFVLTTPTK